MKIVTYQFDFLSSNKLISLLFSLVFGCYLQDLGNNEFFVAVNSIASPCVRNCCLNEHDICLGCFRSLDEIMNWSAADDAEKQHILQQAGMRRQHQACQLVDHNGTE